MLAAIVVVGSATVLTGTMARANVPCAIQPRTYADVERLLDGPASVTVTTIEGTRYGAESPSTDEIEALLHRFLACSGSGEPLRVWSLYTDGYLARLLSRERGYDRARYAFDAVARPIPSDHWPMLRKVGEPVRDAQGRTAVDATIWYPNLAREKRLRFTLVWVDDHLRIEEIDGEITFSVP